MLSVYIRELLRNLRSYLFKLSYYAGKYCPSNRNTEMLNGRLAGNTVAPYETDSAKESLRKTAFVNK